MEKLEILLINYFAVLFLTVSIAVFIHNDRSIKSLTAWFVLFHVALAFLLYKIIQIYDGFFAIYLADFLIFCAYIISHLLPHRKRKNKIDFLAESLPILHKLTSEEFSEYIAMLFKAFNFQSVRQVKIKSDDDGNSFDHFLLARQDGNLIEIRMLPQTKNITEDSVNLIANNFRESTSQATSWLLATSAKCDKNTQIYINNSGMDLKLFDSKTISELVYSIAPNYKPAESWSKKTFIKLLDFVVNYLSSIKAKLNDQSLSPDIEYVDGKTLLKDALEQLPTKEINNLESNETLAVNYVAQNDSGTIQTPTTEPKKRRKRTPTTTTINPSESDTQGNLDLPPPITAHKSQLDGTQKIETLNTYPNELDDSTFTDAHNKIETTETTETTEILNNPSIVVEEVFTQAQEFNNDEIVTINIDDSPLTSIEDITIQDVSNDDDPLASLEEFSMESTTSSNLNFTELDEFALLSGTEDVLGDFPIASNESLSSESEIYPVLPDKTLYDDLTNLTENEFVESVIGTGTLDLSDLGAALQPPTLSKRKPRNPVRNTKKGTEGQ